MATPSSILVVDDCEVERTYLCEILDESGYHCDVTSDGPDALKKVRQRDYDLVVCDVYMDELSGIEVLQRATMIRPDLKFVMVTGAEETKLAVTAMRHGAVDYLVKPVRRAEFVDAIKRAFAAKSPRRHAQSCISALRDEIVRCDAAIEQEKQRSEGLCVELQELRRRFGHDLVDGLSVTLNIIRAKDPALADHSRRVSDLAVEYAESQRRPSEEILAVQTVALLHDVGLMGLAEDLVARAHTVEIPDHEREMYCHSLRSARGILAGIDRLNAASLMLKELHETQQAIVHCDVGDPRLEWSTRVLLASEAYDSAVHWAGSPSSTPTIRDTARRVIGETFWADFVAFSASGGRTSSDTSILARLHPGDILQSDIFTNRGVLVARRGFELTEERIRTIVRLLRE